MTQSSNMHPLVYILDTSTLIFSSYGLFTVYPNRIMQQQPTPLLVITTIAQEGSPKEHRPSKDGYIKLKHLHMHQGSPLFPIFCALSCSLHHHSSVPKATFTPSMQPNLCLPHTCLVMQNKMFFLLHFFSDLLKR